MAARKMRDRFVNQENLFYLRVFHPIGWHAVGHEACFCRERGKMGSAQDGSGSVCVLCRKFSRLSADAACAMLVSVVSCVVTSPSEWMTRVCMFSKKSILNERAAWNKWILFKDARMSGSEWGWMLGSKVFVEQKGGRKGNAFCQQVKPHWRGHHCLYRIVSKPSVIVCLKCVLERVFALILIHTKSAFLVQ